MKYLTRKEVAQHLRVHERTVDRWIEKGDLKAHKLGSGRTSLMRIKDTDLEKFINKLNN